MTAEHRNPHCVRSTVASSPSSPVPSVARCALESYREHHLHPGATLHRLLCGDVFGAWEFADAETRAGLSAIIAYVVAEMHPLSYGSPVKVQDWLALRAKEAR